MIVHIISVFLTLVLGVTSSWAAPQKHIKHNANHQEAAKTKSGDNAIDDQGLIITNPPADVTRKQKRSNFYYPWRQSISPRIGIFSEADFNNSHLVLGVNYLLPKRRSPHYEVGADLIANGDGHVNLAKRWILTERSEFRPFYKLGAMIRIHGKDKLATLVDLDNYYLKAVIGLENFIRTPVSLRVELEGAFNANDIFLLLNFGYSWAW